MRELKFRVWSKNLNRFYSSEYFSSEDLYADENGIVQLSHNDWVIQQYTGLKDRNNVEVYEGDIVEYNPDEPIFRIGIIEYSDYYNGWSIKDRNCYPASEYGQYSLASPFLSFNNVKIIGNIFETPELLK